MLKTFEKAMCKLLLHKLPKIFSCPERVSTYVPFHEETLFLLDITRYKMKA